MLDQATSAASVDLEDARRQRDRWESIMHRAQNDRSFRARLVASPAQVLQQEGFHLRPQAEVTLIDYDPRRVVIFLPPLQPTLMGKPRES